MNLEKAMMLSENINDLKGNELKEVSAYLTKIARGRYDTMKKYESPAFKKIEKNYGRPSIKRNATANERKRATRIARDFILKKTSTKTGLEEWEDKISKKIGKVNGFDYSDLDIEEKRNFWKTWNQADISEDGESDLMSLGKNAFKSLDSEQKKDLVSRVSNGELSIDEMYEKALKTFEGTSNIFSDVPDFK